MGDEMKVSRYIPMGFVNRDGLARAEMQRHPQGYIKGVDHDRVVGQLEADLARVTAERDAGRLSNVQYINLLASTETTLGALSQKNARLRETLALYECAGSPDCRVPRLKDGTCARDATGNVCGEHAHRALEGDDA